MCLVDPASNPSPHACLDVSRNDKKENEEGFGTILRQNEMQESA